MGWAFFYMFVILKIPVLLALWIVWWAVRDEPSAAEVEADEGGGGGGHPRTRPPRPPRRGPHRDRPLPSPPRVRGAVRRGARTH